MDGVRNAPMDHRGEAGEQRWRWKRKLPFDPWRSPATASIDC
jgi:hypothetical protein